MAFNSSSIGSQAKKFQGDSMQMAASAVSANASEEEIRGEVAEVVAKMLDALPTVITFFISETWAAKLTASLVDIFGSKLLEWIE